MTRRDPAQIRIKVVGVGGAGGNALHRMARPGVRSVDYLALNTDMQALARVRGVPTFAIGPGATGGMGSGGRPEIGRKAMKESQEQVSKILEGSDMVFITAGMGGGTGTGAAPLVAEITRRQGALTVGVVTLPFSFEGPARMRVAQDGLRALRSKVDTLIAVENDRLLPSITGKVSLEKAFQLADEVLRHGVQGISDIVTVPGLINVDFADVKAIMAGGGPSFLAVGEGRGKWAAIEAAHMAVSNQLFDAPLEGAAGVLFNITGGKDLTLNQVHEVADVIRKASKCDANVIFGVVQQKRLNKRVFVTLVATGIGHSAREAERPPSGINDREQTPVAAVGLSSNTHRNGHATPSPTPDRLL